MCKKIKFLALVIWPGWLCIDGDNDNDNDNDADKDTTTTIHAIAIGSFRLMPNEPKTSQKDGCQTQ